MSRMTGGDSVAGSCEWGDTVFSDDDDDEVIVAVVVEGVVLTGDETGAGGGCGEDRDDLAIATSGVTAAGSDALLLATSAGLGVDRSRLRAAM